MPQRHTRRGLTLIEILIVVAILGIFMAALLYFVFPSDERRCELEAKRLAAYLTSAGAESAMRDGAARVAFDIGASTGEREVTKIGADITRDLWERDKKGGVHQVKAPVGIDTVDTPAVPELKAGLGYVLFRNGKCPQGAVVILGIDEVFYSVVVPSTGGEIRVERGRATKPTAGTDGQRPQRKKSGSSKSTTSSPPDYSSGSLGSVPGYTPPPSSRSRSRSSSSASKSSTKSSPKSTSSSSSANDDFINDPDYNEPNLPEIPELPNVGSDKETETGNDSNSNNNACTAGQTRCRDSKVVEQCSGGTWVPVRECAVGQQCSGGNCVAGNLGNPSVEPTNHLLTGVTVTKPASVNNLLGGLINNSLDSGQINWIVHRKVGTTASDTLGFWLVQAQRKENTAAREYELKADVPTYPLRERETCAYDNGIAGLAATGRCFETELDNSTIGLYIPNNTADEGMCQYFFIELVHVSIELDYNNEREMKVEGTLSLRSARELVIEGQSVKEKLEELEIPMDGDLTGDGDNDSWVISFTGRTESVVFSDDPSNQDDVPPNCLQ